MKLKDPKLYDLPDSDFATGSEIAEAIKKAGYTDGAKEVIGQQYLWNMTKSELFAYLAKQSEVQSSGFSAAACASRQHNDNLTQSIEECGDYTCPACGGIYAGDGWREKNGQMVCPSCAEAC